VSLFGGPNTGKSTLAARLFAELKLMGYNCELVTEYVKTWTYNDRKPESFDQVYILGQQIRREDTALRGGFDFIITDSPVGLSCFYAQQLGTKFWRHEFEIARCLDQQYPSLNFLVTTERKPADYNDCGRFQTFEQAAELDEELWYFMLENYLKTNFNIVPRDNYEFMKRIVLENVCSQFELPQQEKK